MAKKKESFEIYEGEGRNGKPKKYIVAPTNSSVVDLKYYCKRFFNCSEKHIQIRFGFINNDELYFETPEKSGTRTVYVGYYVR